MINVTLWSVSLISNKLETKQPCLNDWYCIWVLLVSQSHTKAEQLNKGSWLSEKYPECVWAVECVWVSQREEKGVNTGIWSSGAVWPFISTPWEKWAAAILTVITLNVTTFSWLHRESDFPKLCCFFILSFNGKDTLLHVQAKTEGAWHGWRIQGQDSICSEPPTDLSAAEH